MTPALPKMDPYSRLRFERSVEDELPEMTACLRAIDALALTAWKATFVTSAHGLRRMLPKQAKILHKIAEKARARERAA
jgi:hypothetical protein